MIDTLPLFHVILSGGLTLSLPKSYKTFEDIANYYSTAGSSSILREYVFAYTYPYSVSSRNSEYLSDSAYLIRPFYTKPLFMSVGGRIGKSYLQVEGGFWGSYIDTVGDYDVSFGKISFSSYSSLLKEFTVSGLFTTSRRSAYIGRYPYGDTVLDFYENWIYFPSGGLEFVSRGDGYGYFSGFVYNNSGVPLWAGFYKAVNGYNIRFRQISFLSTTILPVRVEGEVGRVFVRGRYNLDFYAFIGYIFNSENFKNGLIFENKLGYTGFFEGGEMGISARWFLSGGGEVLGFEPVIRYRFAKRFRPEVFIGYLYPVDKALFGGISLNLFRRNFTFAYNNSHRSFYLGMEFEYAKFGF